MLASVFKDLYTKDIIGKDTVSNLIKTKSGRSSYHDRYVEELQQVTCKHCSSFKCDTRINLFHSVVIYFFDHAGSCWIQPACERGRHAGGSYNSGQSSGCFHRETGVWEYERDDGRRFRSPGPPYRWDGNIVMNSYNVFYCCLSILQVYLLLNTYMGFYRVLIPCVCLQSNQPFPGVWTMIFSKWTTWFPPRTTCQHINHRYNHQHQVRNPLWDSS